MSIGRRVAGAIDRMEASDPEGALFAVCAAMDATAKKEHGKGGRSAYKGFIHANLGLITDIAFGGTKILNIKLGYDHPEIKTTEDGLCSIQDILYHAVRCGLYHEAKLPDNLKFSNERMIRVEKNSLVLPASLIYGFIVAVVVSPGNAEEVSPKTSWLNLASLAIPINKLWGRRSELLWLLEIEAEMKRAQADEAASASKPPAAGDLRVGHLDRAPVTGADNAQSHQLDAEPPAPMNITEFTGLFEEIKVRYFPRWDKSNEWCVRFGNSTELRDSTGYCDSKAKTVFLCERSLCAMPLPGKRAFIVHEICHAVGAGGHNRRWANAMESRAVKADACGEIEVAHIIRSDITSYAGPGVSEEYSLMTAYNVVNDIVDENSTLSHQQIVREVAKYFGYAPRKVEKDLGSMIRSVVEDA